MNILIKGIDIDILSKGVFCANLVTKNGKSYILIKVPDENGYAQNKYFPLNEISTPHSRLIDADKLLEAMSRAVERDRHWVNFFGIVEEAPTIIEAEE